MRDLETIMKETKSFAYQLLNKPDLKRSVFLEGIIHLEIIIDNIILSYFFGYPLHDKIKISDKVGDFSKSILNDFTYRKKVNILKICGIISPEKGAELVDIVEKRNLAAHSIAIQLTPDLTGWIKGRKQKELKKIDDTFIEEYKKNFSECYAYLMVKLLSLYNPNREDLKIE